MWISVCKSGYKTLFCCGKQRTANFKRNTCCGMIRIAYNAPPSTDAAALHAGIGRAATRRKAVRNKPVRLDTQ
ncbi:hypothetical protein FCN80_22760 [Martelella alba]|uniref:Uncharacterized protein n=1 Tax=Martelella alba TaxID=2590451 RepID=A0ABY2SEE1_9HYPH|nr:hypothetical protein FCN80_22760 [Martelella alba]